MASKLIFNYAKDSKLLVVICKSKHHDWIGGDEKVIINNINADRVKI